MKPVLIIDTFKTVSFHENKKPIVICDIDHTFLRPKFDYNYYYEKMKHEYSDQSELKNMVDDIFNMAINVGIVKQTDEEGFSIMLERINKLQGKLIFLTARGIFSHEKTIRDLQTAGLENPELFEIHYTSNEITKGDYIKKNNLLDNYDHHIFIDDYPYFLESALKIYPDMNCYLFKY